MTIDEKLDLLMSNMQTIQQDVSEIKHKVTCIELTIENELQVNIRRVAEGHVDLFRNMAELKSITEIMNSKLEMNGIYIAHHDSEIKKLKVL